MKFFSPKKIKKIKKGKSVGIHITDKYIRAVLMENKSDGANIIYSREIPLPKTAIKDGEVIKPAILEKKLEALKKESGIKDAYIVIPDEHSEMFILHGYEKGQPIDKVIAKYIEENYGMDPKNVLCNYEIIESDSGKDISVRCLSKELVEAYKSVFSGAGIRPIAFLGEAQSISQLLVGGSHNLMVDFGEEKTKISRMRDGLPHSFVCIDAGGNECKKIIEKFLDTSTEDAESIYDEYGFLPAHHEKGLLYKLTAHLQPVIDVINQEQIELRKNNIDSEMKIMVYGDNADTRGFADYLSNSASQETRHVDIEKDLPLSWSGVPQILKREVVKFAPAIYAAASGFVS